MTQAVAIAAPVGVDPRHGSLVVDEQIRQIGIQIAFAARNLGTQEPIA